MPTYPARRIARGTKINDDPQHACYFLLTCGTCGLRVDHLTWAEVCRRQDQHDAIHKTAEIGLPQ